MATPTAAAAAAGDVEGCIDALFEAGPGDCASEALWHAAGATTGDPLRCVKLALGWGGKVGHTSSHKATTPLHEAGGKGNPEVAETLLSQGADIEAKANDGTAPLHCASYGGHTSTVTALLAKGADIEAKNNDGKTSLHLASLKGHAGTVTALLDHGHAGTVTALLDHGADPSIKDSDGETAHSLAAGAVAADAELMARLRPIVCPEPQARAFAASLGIHASYLDSEFDRCYCPKCYKARYPSTIADGSGGTYVVPRGWTRLGLKAPPRALAENIFKQWSASYHGVKCVAVLRSIFAHGQFMIPGDKLLNGTVLRGNKCGGRQDTVFYTSPTVRYAGLKFYAEPQDWTAPDGTTMRASIVLQCRQKPGTFRRQGETMAFERKWPGHLRRTCPHVDNLDEIEWMSSQKEGAIPYGLLIRVWEAAADPEQESYKSPVD